MSFAVIHTSIIEDSIYPKRGVSYLCLVSAIHVEVRDHSFLVIALDERNVYLQELNSPIRPELSYRYMNYTVCVFRMGMFVMSEGYHGVYNATHVIYKSLKSK